MSETYIDLVKRIFGECNDELADALLWTCTAFPFNDNEGLIKQLKKVKLDSGGDFGLAMKQADEAMAKANKPK